MNTDSLRRLLDHGFYANGLDDAKKSCYNLARSGPHTLAFFTLGNIFRDLYNHFDSMAPIDYHEGKRITSIYQAPMNQLLDLIDTGEPGVQIVSHLEQLVLLHITVHMQTS